MKNLEALLESGITVVSSKEDENETVSHERLELLWTALVCLKYIRYMYI